jgi:hypothetical protein
VLTSLSSKRGASGASAGVSGVFCLLDLILILGCSGLNVRVCDRSDCVLAWRNDHRA